MQPAQELLTVVRARAANTPCVVRQTSDGFDIGLDVTDPRWFDQLRAWGLTETATHHVRASEPERRLTITDELSALRWVTDTDGRRRPVLVPIDHRPATRTSVQKSTTVGRDLVLDAASVLGWTVRRSLRETFRSAFRLRRPDHLLLG